MLRRLVPALAVLFLAAWAGFAAPAAHATSPNPIAGEWGLYTGDKDFVYPAYAAASGKKKQMLARIANQPRAAWFSETAIMPRLQRLLSTYISNYQKGDPNALVQLGIFREFPDTEAKKNIPLTPQEQADYKAWVDLAAQTIGNTRALIVLEPDLAENASYNGKRTQVADPDVRLGLVNYAAQKFSALPRATVYLDAGASDWLTPAADADNLVKAGIQYVHGIAVGATHAAAVGPDVTFGTRVISALAARGFPGKTMIEDTSDNGKPYTRKQFIRKHHRVEYSDDVACRTRREKFCMTLGVPPTDNPSKDDKVLHLNAKQRAEVAQYVDGYIWFGRPWIGGNGSTHTVKRMYDIARTTPYQH